MQPVDTDETPYRGDPSSILGLDTMLRIPRRYLFIVDCVYLAHLAVLFQHSVIPDVLLWDPEFDVSRPFHHRY